ncbi:hypothetical protein UYSO10_1317 [Kosakonia radicincitans]|uniref:hypothetical protein n=1 Tax=Kosakonia radicincitans TaxID=283686 RepID=UPI0011838983|nr:hypothetical protein [Kosakonia radicincitans]VVT47268.1 hypothetical protein UYSO10_1317 [Kosakonia radicincitans]
MNNEKCRYSFNYICACYQDWHQGSRRPAHPLDLHMRVLVIAGVLLSVLGNWEYFHGRMNTEIALAVFAGPSVLILGLAMMASRQGWPSFMDDLLKNYEPADVDAFLVLQASVIISGKLEKEALGLWIEQERMTLATVCPPPAISESEHTDRGQL